MIRPLIWTVIFLKIIHNDCFIKFTFFFYCDDETDDQGPELPTRSNEEFRPFIRRLPEFKFWYATTKSTVIGMICTFFDMFNIPVFWPILVMYFITLFCITMKRQIKVSKNHYTYIFVNIRDTSPGHCGFVEMFGVP